MTTDGHETDPGAAAQPVQGFMALPNRTEKGREAFSRCLADVVRTVGLDIAPAEGPGDRRTWEHRARVALREACRQGVSLSEESFDALVKAGIHDPDPSSNRQFVEPALNAFGRRRARTALLGYLRTGTDPERAGAARAWYWTALPLRMPLVRARNPGAGRAEPDDRSAVSAEWHEAALREFVANEHLDVRRCLIPGLPLGKSFYRQELHDLVDTATATARSHPDDYIRHRVEHQVGDTGGL
ncbi:hypothetical protein OG753_22615 [Streptomyces sp. NBC_00029]|uniref:hypothetical protein n=1 Tax=Streptomyces sp. NBC_00029 TaxID=2903613 RepID=UPI0032494AE8